MNDSDTALEHLKVIRGLMEKATVYRAVTAPTALVGGVLAVLTGITIFIIGEEFSSNQVLFIWLGIFFVVNAFHHILIWKTSQKEGEPYLSSGFSMAMKAILPAMFVGGIVGLSLGFGPAHDVVGASLAWASFYGLALMATSGFSPRSLRVLGLAFTVVGSVLLGIHWLQAEPLLDLGPSRLSSIVMGSTFGFFHLIYAGFLLGTRRHAPSA